MKYSYVLFIFSIFTITLNAAKQDISELKLKDWSPKSMLKTKTTKIKKAVFPVFDVHNHLRKARNVDRIIHEMNAAGVKTVVNLDGYSGEYLKSQLLKFDFSYPGRFLTFAILDFSDFDDKDWSERTVKQLEKDFVSGAAGLKIHKSLGLYKKYKSGKLIPVDDPKLDPIWDLCGKYKKPVMIHTSDPAAFFTPLDEKNERWHELNSHPGWLFHGKNYPSRKELLNQRNKIISKS